MHAVPFLLHSLLRASVALEGEELELTVQLGDRARGEDALLAVVAHERQAELPMRRVRRVLLGSFFVLEVLDLVGMATEDAEEVFLGVEALGVDLAPEVAIRLLRPLPQRLSLLHRTGQEDLEVLVLGHAQAVERRGVLVLERGEEALDEGIGRGCCVLELRRRRLASDEEQNRSSKGGGSDLAVHAVHDVLSMAMFLGEWLPAGHGAPGRKPRSDAAQFVSNLTHCVAVPVSIQLPASPGVVFPGWKAPR